MTAPQMVACSTFALASLVALGIGRDKHVSMFTMGFGAVPSAPCGSLLAPQEVLIRGNWLKMIVIDALAHTAEMVRFKARWHTTLRQHIAEGMGGHKPLPVPEPSIAIAIATASPKPTGTKFWDAYRDGAVLINLLPETEFDGNRGSSKMLQEAVAGEKSSGQTFYQGVAGIGSAGTIRAFPTTTFAEMECCGKLGLHREPPFSLPCHRTLARRDGAFIPIVYHPAWR